MRFAEAVFSVAQVRLPVCEDWSGFQFQLIAVDSSSFLLRNGRLLPLARS
jgi:hypothetical protein